MQTEKLSELDLVALLCSRVCHDVISPVGAIVNGLEVLEDDDDPEMHAHAMELIKKSAAQASAKLQFSRLAFGAAGSAGAEIDLQDAQDVARRLLENDKVSLSWSGPAATMPKDVVKLLLNMLLIANGAIPRGGDLAVTVGGEADGVRLLVTARGKAARVPEEVERFMAGKPVGEAVDARGVQPLFAGLLAQSVSMSLVARMVGEDFEISAEKG